MKIKKILILALITVVFAGTVHAKPAPAVYSLIERIAPEDSKRFSFEITDPNSARDFFIITVRNNKINIKGNNQISLARGIGYYLEKYQGITVTQYNTSFSLPKKLSDLSPVRIETEVLNRFFLDRDSYTGERIYWGWNEWQQEIDRLALNGATAVYVPVGIEIVWYNTLRELGFSDAQVGGFIPMPSYSSWWLRGLYYGGGEKLPGDWHEKQYLLQKKILSELEKWEITPVAEGFNGMFPPTAETELWNGNPVPASLCYDEETLQKVSSIYYGELHRLYGNFRYYNIAPANGCDAASLVRALKKANPDGITLYDLSYDNISPEPLGKVERGDILLVKDEKSFSEWDPSGITQHHDWIYKSGVPKDEYPSGKKGSLMLGGIMIPADDEYGFVAYANINRIWGKTADIKDFVSERYGKQNENAEKALETLIPFAYGEKFSKRNIIYGEPSLEANPMEKEPHDEYLSALKAFVKEAPSFVPNGNYQHDLVLFTKIAVHHKAEVLIGEMSRSAQIKDIHKFESQKEEFLQLLKKLDELLATRDELMFANYIGLGRSKGNSFEEKGIYEGDIRKYSTVWGDRYVANMHRMNDFMHSERNGIIGDYYYNRWFIYLKAVQSAINGKINGDIDYYGIGEQWRGQRNKFEEYPQSSSVLKAVETINML